jgi:hypothetical protein
MVVIQSHVASPRLHDSVREDVVTLIFQIWLFVLSFLTVSSLLPPRSSPLELSDLIEC